jgi:hypothetical protein
MCLVDLAGSERIDYSRLTPAQTEEAAAVKSSLCALMEDVFMAIGAHQTHIPYLNSQLTYLLQYLLKNGRVLMIVNLIPTREWYQESCCALRLAAQIHNCALSVSSRRLTLVLPR